MKGPRMAPHLSPPVPCVAHPVMHSAAWTVINEFDACVGRHRREMEVLVVRLLLDEERECSRGVPSEAQVLGTPSAALGKADVQALAFFSLGCPGDFQLSIRYW